MSLVIIVSPRVRANGKQHPTEFECWLEGGPFLCNSRQPFLRAARILIGMGHDPEAILIMRHARSKADSLKARLGAAASLTVDEFNGTRLVSWKPFPRSVGFPGISESYETATRMAPSSIDSKS
jgi:hypothetical protein